MIAKSLPSPTMPRDLLGLVPVQPLHWSGKRRSYSNPPSCRACRAKEVGIAALLLVLFCSSSALADDFGLGTAGPSNYTILETGTGVVKTNNNNTISFTPPGASQSQANLGINSGGSLNSNNSGSPVVQGTYYKFSSNTDTGTVVGTTTSGTDVNAKLSQAAVDAINASSSLASLSPSQTFGTVANGATISALSSGRNVIAVTNLSGPLVLNSNGFSNVSFVINITPGSNNGVKLGSVGLIGTTPILPTNVIFNVVGPNSGIGVSGPGPGNGIILDVNALPNASQSLDMALSGNSTWNGELIYSQNITLETANDVEAAGNLPEASTTAYFTLGPLSLVAVMLLHRRFSRRKQAVVQDCFG